MGLAITILVAGIILIIVGLMFAFESDDYWLLGLAGFAIGVILFLGGIGGASVESDKTDCLKTLPQVSQKETKWLGGECYVKANDGKFVPLEWVEKGYNK